MDLAAQFLDLILHLDRHLAVLIAEHGVWVYGILFLIVFCETGLVVTPFLPGDSLLFVAGTLAGAGSLGYWELTATLVAAALCGDNANYWVGRFIGPRVFHDKVRWLKKEYLDRTHAFYEKHGGKTIIIARFVPIVRTFAPFVAGIGRMGYARYLAFCVAGAVLWVGSLVSAGFFLGNLAVVKNNLTLVIFAIILVSISPGIVEYLRARRARA